MRMMVAACRRSCSLAYSSFSIRRWVGQGVLLVLLGQGFGVVLLGGKANLLAKKYCVLDVSLSDSLPLGMRSELE